MITEFFALIRLILELIGLWKYFSSERDKDKVAEGQVNTQERDKAVDAQKGAQDESEFDKAQDDIIRHRPRL